MLYPVPVILILASAWALATGDGPASGAAQPGPAPASANAVEIPNQEIVPLYVSGSRPLAMLTLGDGPPSPVVFDTGTDENILKSSYASRLGLKVTGSSPLTDAATGKTATVPVVSLSEPRLSGVSVEVPTAQLLDYANPDEVGIFGPYSFGRRLVVLEAGLNRVRVVRPDIGFLPAGPATPYRDNLPSLGIRVNGLPVQAHVDTGNDSELILGAELLGKVRLKAPARVVAIAVSALGEQEVMGGQLDGEVEIGSVRVRDPNVTFSGKGAGANLGFPLLRKLTLVLDPANKRSWLLDPAPGPGALADFAGRYGVRSITAGEGGLTSQRDGQPPVKLAFLGGDLFENPKTGDCVQFYRRDGKVIGLDLITTDGDVVGAIRN